MRPWRGERTEGDTAHSHVSLFYRPKEGQHIHTFAVYEMRDVEGHADGHMPERSDSDFYIWSNLMPARSALLSSCSVTLIK